MRLKTFILSFLTITNIQAQATFAPPTRPVSISVTSTISAIKIDGKLEESDWQRAEGASQFVQIEPNQGNKSKFRTIVKVMSDDKNLYFGVMCFDTVGKNGYRTPDLKRDFSWRSFDMFAIAIDGFHDRRNSMSFATNAYGAQKDYLTFDDFLFDGDWNGLWNVRTSRTDSAWIAEFAIPWKTLRYARSELNQTWGVNFLRMRRQSNEISVWSPYPRAFGFNRMDYSGDLTNIPAPKSGTNLQVNPYFLFSRQKNVKGIVENQPKLGGEIKWAINQNSVLDLTYNTDFAQTDADIQVNNLSRFSVFFPEKRQFFLENSSLFGGNLEPDARDNSGGDMVIQPFFSRRIGLDGAGNPIPIDFGGRYINRTIKQSIGGILIKQRETDNSPNTIFGVGRYSRFLGKQNRIGGMAIVKSKNDLGQIAGYTNMVGMIDGFFRLNQSKSIDFMVIPSANSNGTGEGLSSFMRFIHNSNQVKYWWVQSLVSKEFSPETGFVSRTNVISTNFGSYLYIRSAKLPKSLRAYEPGGQLSIYHQFDTRQLIERNFNIIPVGLNFQNGALFQISINNYYQLLTDVFSPLGVKIKTGTYNYNRIAATIANNQSRKLSYRFKYELGDFFDGRLNTTDFQLNIVPIPNIALKFRYFDNKFNEVGINKSNDQITLLNFEGRFALNPRVQLTGLYQYNTQNNLNALNIRFAWEYRPLSFLYLIWNNRVFDQKINEIVSRTKDDAVFGKISFLRQF